MFIQQLSHVGVEAKLLHRGNVHVDLHTIRQDFHRVSRSSNAGPREV